MKNMSCKSFCGCENNFNDIMEIHVNCEDGEPYFTIKRTKNSHTSILSLCKNEIVELIKNLEVYIKLLDQENENPANS